MPIEKREIYIVPGIDRIPTALIKAGGRKICSGIQKLINSIWNKKELPQQCKKLVIVFCSPQILEKEWEYSEAVHQLFIEFKKA
jgi:hypothetical protein